MAYISISPALQRLPLSLALNSYCILISMRKQINSRHENWSDLASYHGRFYREPWLYTFIKATVDILQHLSSHKHDRQEVFLLVWSGALHLKSDTWNVRAKRKLPKTFWDQESSPWVTNSKESALIFLNV